MSSTPSEHSSWTAAGADAAAQKTYVSVKEALKSIISNRSIDVFLQGSYANSTNVRADSDVDVVVMTSMTFTGNFQDLGPVSRTTWDDYPPAPFTPSQLRREVTDALVSYYGSSRVKPRNKCVQVDKVPGYVDADVVPCIEYHRFAPGGSMASYIEGIAIYPQQGSLIINFPKRHIDNGRTKNAACGGNYKPTVRQMKHLRNRANGEGRLRDEEAPGYLLECMTYNAPNQLFVPNDSQRLLNVLAWLKNADKLSFWSCDGVHRLFVDDPGKFSVYAGQRIISALWDAY